jgi:phage shock protein A
MLAIQQGRDDLAKQALVRQAEHMDHGTQLQQTWQLHRAETEKLKAQLRDLNDKIEEAKRKKNLLLARQRRAEAQKRIAQTMSGLSEKSAFEAFARMEEKISQNERQIRASAEIDEEFSGDRLLQDFKHLELAGGAASADARLLAMKQQMGMLPAPAPAEQKALGAGTAGAAPAAPATSEPAPMRTEEQLIAEIEKLKG